MSKAYQCDRCGRYFKTSITETNESDNTFEPSGRYHLRIYFETTKEYVLEQEWLDLCGECREELNEWIMKGAK